VSTFGECSLPEICIAPCLCCSFSDWSVKHDI
jgi:hypothetical protein